jgi:predicted TIM-barrel fold metal-dependent hydrolase
MRLTDCVYTVIVVFHAAFWSASVMNAETTTDTYIDVHFHADARPQGGGDLPKVDEWMKSNNVSRLVVLQFDKTQPRNEQEAQSIVENFKAYKGRMYRFCVLSPKNVQDKEAAVKILKKEKADGAIGFGEYYGSGREFDDPKSMQLYAACAEVGMPVLFHMDNSNNKDDAGLSHLENALKSYPQCIFIGHGPGFWAKMKAADILLGKYKNLYADISAGSGFRAIKHDLASSREFMVRHADRVLFGTDGGPWSFGKKAPPQFALVESLGLPADVKAKICRKNAEELFGF